ncbi:hypothetical protein QYE76_038687 [Lolium multiflorum]|uniref:DUF8039 domain-containing protein n=1 Tax=Lolium multiflorum TaxID=4521 RepID=A0AAD8WRH2_LOLMU|nr:hypothetical protein QYE76_038687 [Lolium multiflorum]
MAITNHYYFELTPEQRRNPQWHPDYSPTWESFFINRRERALSRHEEGGPPPSNFNEAGRAVVARPDSPGRHGLPWPPPRYPRPSPRVLTRRPESTATPMPATMMTATTTTTVATTTGLGTTLAVADHAALSAVARPRRRQTTPPRRRQTTPSSPAAPPRLASLPRLPRHNAGVPSSGRQRLTRRRQPEVSSRRPPSPPSLASPPSPPRASPGGARARVDCRQAPLAPSPHARGQAVRRNAWPPRALDPLPGRRAPSPAWPPRALPMPGRRAPSPTWPLVEFSADAAGDLLALPMPTVAADLLALPMPTVAADLLALPMPTVAAVTGHASAGGFLLALCHDYRVMRADRGVLYMSEVDLGLPLPPRGYKSAIPKWTAFENKLMDHGITPQTWDWPERSKLWLFAHGAGLDPKTGLIIAKGKWKDKIEAIVPKLVDAIDKVRKGEYIPDRENDELTLALGNPEHVGRDRVKVAVGYVYPSEDGAMHHHMPIPPGCVRVGVDEVVSGFEKVELDIPRGEDERTLADVKHGFALWPKKYVVLLQRPPTPTHEQQMPSTPPGGSPGEQPSPHLPERDPSVSPPSRDPPRKTASVKRNGTPPRKKARKEKNCRLEKLPWEKLQRKTRRPFRPR